MTLIKKYYELEKWDKVRHWDDVHTFSHMDSMYAKWHTDYRDWETDRKSVV